jgi:hypothetical protein
MNICRGQALRRQDGLGPHPGVPVTLGVCGRPGATLGVDTSSGLDVGIGDLVGVDESVDVGLGMDANDVRFAPVA